MWELFVSARARNVPISGTVVQDKRAIPPAALTITRRWYTTLSSTEAHKGLRGALGPSLVIWREGVLGHHPANRRVPKCTQSRVKKSVSELFDHTLYR